jgi:hypothetical protein
MTPTGAGAMMQPGVLAFDEASRRGVPLLAWSDVGVFPILGMDWRTYRDKGAELLGERLAGWQECYPDVQVRSTTRLGLDLTSPPSDRYRVSCSRGRIVTPGS